MKNRNKVIIAILVCAGLGLAAYLSTAAYTYLMSWGSRGSAPGQFSGPCDVAVDSARNVYVADTYNNRIQKFQPNSTYIYSRGSAGSGNGQFRLPMSIAVDNSGNIFVADYSNNRIQQLNSSGSYVAKIGSLGTGPGQFNGPGGVAISPTTGQLYVVDTNNNRVQVFNYGPDLGINFVRQWGSRGSGNGQFNRPKGIAIDSSGNVYVADVFNNRIQRFTANGGFITRWGNFGVADGSFKGPRDVAVGPSGDIYVADSGNNRVQRFTSSGAFVDKWGKGGGDWGLGGSSPGEFSNPYGIAVDAAGGILVSEIGNSRIQKFSAVAATKATGTMQIKGDAYRTTTTQMKSLMPKVTVTTNKYTKPDMQMDMAK